MFIVKVLFISVLEVKTALRKFILLETHKFVDGEAERRLMEALQSKVGFHPLLPAKIKEVFLFFCFIK